MITQRFNLGTQKQWAMIAQMLLPGELLLPSRLPSLWRTWRPLGTRLRWWMGQGGSLGRELAVWWWSRRQLSRKTRRQWLDKLYPPDQPMEWQLSNGIFHRPVVSGKKFIHPVPAPVVKWVARVRAGCLASRFRLFTHHMGPSPACPCCGADEEDEEHMVAGCPATGSSDWALSVMEVWNKSAAALTVTVNPPLQHGSKNFGFPSWPHSFPQPCHPCCPFPQQC